MMRSYMKLAWVALSLFEANAFVNPQSTSRITSLKAEPQALTLDADLGGMLDAAKGAFGGVSSDAVSDQLDSSMAAATDLFSSLPPEVLAGAGVLIFAGIVSSASSGGDSSSASSKTVGAKKKGPKIDLSIPYDAAARLAFDAWAAGKENADTSNKAYEMFKMLYEDQAVADVIAKQKARELANFDPSKPIPVRSRPAAPVEKTGPDTTETSSETPFFFTEAN